MFYNEIFDCHGNICYVIFINPFYFQCTYGIGAINVRTNFEINQYKIDEFKNMQKSYVLFNV